MSEVRYEFVDNALIIRDKYSSCSIEWGERPVAKEQLGAGEWKDGNPYHRILVPAHIDVGRNRQAIDKFSENVPQNIFKSVSPFRDYQWRMIQLLAVNPYASDLGESNPVLAYCLANNDQFKNIHKDSISWEQANLYSRRKQKLILQWLGFPSEQIIVKLFRKIDCNEMTVGLMRLLRQALKTDNPVIKLLSHHQRITPGMLGLLKTAIAPLVTPELLADVAEDERERVYPNTAEKLTSVYRLQKSYENQIAIPRFTCVNSVNEYHENLHGYAIHAAQCLHNLRVTKEDSLGEPPVEGNEDIVPITSKTQLIAEGKTMKNCVASYVSKILGSEVYIYRVLKPQRATLSIKQRMDGVWDRMELKAKCNKAVKKETAEHVDAWLRANEQFKDFEIKF